MAWKLKDTGEQVNVIIVPSYTAEIPGSDRVVVKRSGLPAENISRWLLDLICEESVEDEGVSETSRWGVYHDAKFLGQYEIYDLWYKKLADSTPVVDWTSRSYTVGYQTKWTKYDPNHNLLHEARKEAWKRAGNLGLPLTLDKPIKLGIYTVINTLEL